MCTCVCIDLAVNYIQRLISRYQSDHHDKCIFLCLYCSSFKIVYISCLCNTCETAVS